MLPMMISYYYDRTLKTCRPYLNTIINIFVFSQVMTYNALIPLFLITFGLLTILNIRQQATRFVPITVSNSNHLSNDLIYTIDTSTTCHSHSPDFRTFGTM